MPTQMLAAWVFILMFFKKILKNKYIHAIFLRIKGRQRIEVYVMRALD